MLTGSGHSTPRHANVKPLTKRSSISLLYAQNGPSQVKLKLDFSGRSVNVKRRSMNIKHYAQILKIKLSEGQITEDTTLRLVNFISVSQSNPIRVKSVLFIIIQNHNHIASEVYNLYSRRHPRP